MQSTAHDDKEVLAGLVERVTFHSADSGFCVLRVKARGQRDLVTVIGSAASVQPGEYIHANGRWDNHRDHGLQFKAASAPRALEYIVLGVIAEAAQRNWRADGFGLGRDHSFHSTSLQGAEHLAIGIARIGGGNLHRLPGPGMAS